MARIRGRLTLFDFQCLTGIDETRISRLERGIRLVRRAEAEAVARALEMTVEELFDERSDGRYIVLDSDGVMAA